MGGISGNAASAVANQHGRRCRRTLQVPHYRSRATVGQPTGHDIAPAPRPLLFGRRQPTVWIPAIGTAP
jgi:hypothetical protein